MLLQDQLVGAKEQHQAVICKAQKDRREASSLEARTRQQLAEVTGALVSTRRALANATAAAATSAAEYQVCKELRKGFKLCIGHFEIAATFAAESWVCAQLTQHIKSHARHFTVFFRKARNRQLMQKPNGFKAHTIAAFC